MDLAMPSHMTKTASHGLTILSTTAKNPMLHTYFMGLWVNHKYCFSSSLLKSKKLITRW